MKHFWKQKEMPGQILGPNRSRPTTRDVWPILQLHRFFVNGRGLMDMFFLMMFVNLVS